MIFVNTSCLTLCLPFPLKYCVETDGDRDHRQNRPSSVTSGLNGPSSRASITARGGLLGLSLRRDGASRGGFALVAVIWSLGLITLLTMALMVGARYRTRVASNYASVIAAEAAAESAINLGIATVLTGTTEPSVRFPLRCRMPGGERVVITVDEEAGKIDLNTASAPVLTRFFTALTRDPSLGVRLADRIVALRNAKKDVNAGTAAPGPYFRTIMQLDQIEGVSPRLFRAALRLVTVRSGRPEPDMDAAPPALRQMLNLEQKAISPARGLPAGGSITIRADVRAPDGARFIREALMSLAEGGQPFLVREWRHGDIDSTASASSARQGDAQRTERSCLQTADVGRT